MRGYFSRIPDNFIGLGRGTFDVLGVRRAWLRPFVRALVDPDVLFPIWAEGVDFEVRNSPTEFGGATAVTARRQVFHNGPELVMFDRIFATGSDLFDLLGRRERFRARFEARVIDGALLLESAAVWSKIGRRFLRLPWPVAPKIRLCEEYLQSEGVQSVEVTVNLPVIGCCYEYRGKFSYEIVPVSN